MTTMYIYDEPASSPWHPAVTPAIGAPVAVSDGQLFPDGAAGTATHAADGPVAAITSDAVDSGLDVFARLAHEMRGPLHALVTSSEVLVQQLAAEALPSAEVSLRSSTTIASAVHRRSLWLKGLVDNLLCAASIQHGRFAVRLQPVNLQDVVAEVAVVVEPLLEERGQALRIRSTVAAPVALGDHGRLSQVLVNLILNASKFSPPDSALAVIVSAQDGELRVTVSDRGIGIPDDEAELLFEPFYRGRNAAGSVEGVGLGLSLVKCIVDAHGGTVRAERRPAGGSRFWFTLPAADAGPSRVC